MVKDSGQRDRTTDLGAVRINNEAITTIASVAAMDIRGVYGMGGALARTVCAVFLNKHGSKGVKIEAREGEVKLTVSIVVEYGVEIPKIADEVQENVKRAVERMTGLVLSEVDVVVEGVHAPAQADMKKDRRA